MQMMEEMIKRAIEATRQMYPPYRGDDAEDTYDHEVLVRAAIMAAFRELEENDVIRELRKHIHGIEKNRRYELDIAYENRTKLSEILQIVIDMHSLGIAREWVDKIVAILKRK